MTVQNTTQTNITHTTLSDLAEGKAYDLLLTYSALDASPVGDGKERGDLTPEQDYCPQSNMFKRGKWIPQERHTLCLGNSTFR